MLQKDLKVIREKMKAREMVQIVNKAPSTSKLQQSKKKRGRKKKAVKKTRKITQASSYKQSL